MSAKKKRWGVFLVVVGSFMLYEAGIPEELALAQGKTAVTRGIVEDKTQTGSRRRGVDYTVHYGFVANGRIHIGRYKCGCEGLRVMQVGDTIDVRYSRANPDRSRPAVITYSAAVVYGFPIIGALLVLTGVAVKFRSGRAAA